MEMKKIASFTVNHNTLKCGMYISRIDGDVTTYDIRMKKPNGGDYLENAGIHTLEHLFATYVRSTEYSDSIIYVGPMGCRTGFYFLTRDLPCKTAVELIKATFNFIKDYEGEIPGSTAIECGNYKDHNLEQAKGYAKDMAEVLKNWTENDVNY